MIEITEKPLSPELVVEKVKCRTSGCVVTYVGLIREQSQGKKVTSVEYQDTDSSAANTLQEIASEIKKKWQLDNVAISHRTGKLMVGEINLVVAIASAHRSEGFAACQYAIDRFKQQLPTKKTESYTDGTVCIEDRNMS